MVSHNCHANHEFLTLVTWVTNVSFAIESFVSYEIVLIMMLQNFPTSKILVSFLLIWQIYYKQGKPLAISLCDCNAKCRLVSVRY